MYMAVWGVLPHSNSIFYRIFVNYTSDFRHFPKNRRFASGGGWQNDAFVHFAVEVCRFGHRLDLPSLYPAGGLAFFAACYPLPLAYFPAPYPPNPLPRPPSPAGKGEPQSLFRRGLRPRHPCTEPPAALTASAMRAPHAGSLRFAAKTIGSGSLLAAPAAKEWGDRGRETSAFEMVLSPGAGIASAARVQVAGMQGAKPLA